LLILRNAFGGAYAAFNCYATGADLVLALPTTRVAVMGPAGKEYVYKDDLRAARAKAKEQGEEWLKAQEAEIGQRYERELMNPREALSLGSISEIVMPDDLRHVLARNLDALLRAYVPCPMTGPQREFH
jgi:acetyl-CoA carboxylase carboxyltransferase component